MAKFKVGDKVNCANYGNGVITKITTSVMPEIPYYVVFESGKEIYLGADRLTLLVAREFIVIRRDGAKTIAELRHDREVIKSGTAICNASDTFDFDTGAKLAFDRLMGREEPKPEPKPAHRFKVGDRVKTKIGTGIITVVDDMDTERPYRVCYDGGYEYWIFSKDAKPAPAPEPPKYYTGKVFCAGCDAGCEWAYKDLIGKVLEIENGNAAWLLFNSHYTSFEDMCNRNKSGKWYEVKE